MNKLYINAAVCNQKGEIKRRMHSKVFAPLVNTANSQGTYP